MSSEDKPHAEYEPRELPETMDVDALIVQMYREYEESVGDHTSGQIRQDAGPQPLGPQGPAKLGRFLPLLVAFLPLLVPLGMLIFYGLIR
ncbi:MAG: hypothetical protein ACOYBY_18520 [Dermatophilaceae bacterium]